jgi:hypothetical protein
MCYNIYGKRERETLKKKGLNTMEKVIRICEITGKVTTIAENVDTATAMQIVKENAATDPFATYRRVVK